MPSIGCVRDIPSAQPSEARPARPLPRSATFRDRFDYIAYVAPHQLCELNVPDKGQGIFPDAPLYLMNAAQTRFFGVSKIDFREFVERHFRRSA
jgi:hypothetical protein